MEMIKVAVCEDSEPIRRHIVRLIGKQTNMVMAVQAGTSRELLDMIKETPVDVVLMDIQLEYRDAGIDATKEVIRYNPNIRVIALTIHEEEEMIVRAYSAGVSDYVIKTQLDEKIIPAILSVYKNNDTVIRSDIADKIIEECVKMHKKQASVLFTLTIVYRLTKSELDLLKLLYDGYTRDEIIIKRNVAESTIKTQIHNILKKLEYRTVAEMVESLREISLFDIIPFDTM